MLGATFTTLDDQSCIPLTLLEVPCDIRSPANNCIWETKGGPCGAQKEVADCKGISNSTAPPVYLTPGDEPQIVLNATVSVEATV